MHGLKMNEGERISCFSHSWRRKKNTHILWWINKQNIVKYCKIVTKRRSSVYVSSKIVVVNPSPTVLYQGKINKNSNFYEELKKKIFWKTCCNISAFAINNNGWKDHLVYMKLHIFLVRYRVQHWITSCK